MITLAENIVDGLLEELSDRRGIDNALDDIELDVYQEMRKALALRVLHEIYSTVEEELTRE